MSKDWIEETIEKIRQKEEWVCDKNRDKIPYTCLEDGSFDDKAALSQDYGSDDGLSWWTNGFFSGLNWLMYMDTKNEKYAEIAKNAEDKIAETFVSFEGLHHDVGFMFVPSSVLRYKQTGSMDARKRALHAANLLAGRFNPDGEFIRAWNDLPDGDSRGWAIIDCMFNISLLFWASKETKDPRFEAIAKRHAKTVAKYFIRENGSSIHIGKFDPSTGQYLGNLAGQGYSDSSAWSRGQGWALYGFTNTYKNTGDEYFLDIAKKSANYILSRLDKSGIVPVDFEQPQTPAWEDSCGAAIIAGGFIELAKYDSVNKVKYIEAAKKILKNLADTRCDWSNGRDAIVLNCTGAYHDKRHHFTMIYADYFFIEAIYKLAGYEIEVW